MMMMQMRMQDVPGQEFLRGQHHHRDHHCRCCTCEDVKYLHNPLSIIVKTNVIMIFDMQAL